jgi:hypothetical protein
MRILIYYTKRGMQKDLKWKTYQNLPSLICVEIDHTKNRKDCALSIETKLVACYN